MNSLSNIRKPHRYEKMVTEQFYRKGILCPKCQEEDGVEQKLSSTGDAEHMIFCPHCDLGFELKITGE